MLDMPDGSAPAHWDRIKDAAERFPADVRPEVVFGPQRDDAHQDHRLLAELMPTEFRDHLILGYEILKWETDTPRPTVFHPLDTGVAEEKARLLHKHYPSQIGQDWFDERRSSACPGCAACSAAASHAEAFVIEKASIGFDADQRRRSVKGKHMRVLVTGHQGYLGTVMVPVLQAAGHEVVGPGYRLLRRLRSGA